MPRGDRTGPFGEGPATGRNMGRCAGGSAPGFAPGADMARGGLWCGGGGCGAGRGLRNRFYATGVPFSAYAAPESAPQLGRNEEIGLLRNEAEHLRGKLADIERRLGEIETI
jgi:hypothetical protein